MGSGIRRGRTKSNSKFAATEHPNPSRMSTAGVAARE
jgi:hypothetical protein